MCGICGYISYDKSPVAPDLVKSMERMENRGSQSCGAVTMCNGAFRQLIEAKPAAIAFHGKAYADRLKGTMGIAHTRYATSGAHDEETILRNAGPLLRDTAIAHNGDTVNVVALRQQVIEGGKICRAETDTEILQIFIEQALEKHRVHQASSHQQYAERVFAALTEVQGKFSGAWSLLIMTARGIIAWRGPRGIRPLVMARRYDDDGRVRGVGFASESSVFNALKGFRNITDVLPGQVWFAPADSRRMYHRVISRAKEKFCVFEFAYLARPDSRFLPEQRRVEMVRRALGSVAAMEVLKAYPEMMIERRLAKMVVVPIPTCPVNAAKEFAKVIGAPVEQAILKAGNKRSFMETSDEKRRRAIDDKFIFIRELVEGKHVILVDDSVVRGNTAYKVIARLRELNVRSVYVVSCFPPVISGCHYGVDMPDPGKFVAIDQHTKTPLPNKAIAKAIGADEVFYISLDGFVEAVGVPIDRLCLGCTTGQYPTLTDGAAAKLQVRQRHRAT